MEIAIVGCGIGGLAAANLLARTGNRITVFDRFITPEPVGSGLIIQTVSLPVLARIGAAPAALALGTKNTHMLGLDVDTGQKILDVHWGRKGDNSFGLGIHRATLFDCLLDATRDLGVRFQQGCEVCDTVLFGASRRIRTKQGQDFGPYDLVIDASGAGSALSPLKSRHLDYGALWATVNWPDQSPLRYDRLEQRYRSASNMIGVLPIGRLPGDETPKAAFFWSLPQSDYQRWRDTPFELWQQQATALWPALDPFIAQLQSHDDLTMARYSHGSLRRPYGVRIAYIGDAAHRASPQLGQGANMALLDAQALTEALSSEPLDRALKTYARARRRHVAVYQTMSWAFTPMYQSNSRTLPLLRNRVLAPLSHLPPVSKVLTSLVKGTIISPYRGYFDASDPPGLPK